MNGSSRAPQVALLYLGVLFLLPKLRTANGGEQSRYMLRGKNTAGETWNRLLNFSMWVLVSSRFLCKTSDTMLSEPKIGTRSFWFYRSCNSSRLAGGPPPS